MARPQVADGRDGLQLWRVATNIFNKLSRTANKKWNPAWGLGVGLQLIVKIRLRNVTKGLGGLLSKW
jgi:hypothetical protein